MKWKRCINQKFNKLDNELLCITLIKPCNMWFVFYVLLFELYINRYIHKFISTCSQSWGNFELRSYVMFLAGLVFQSMDQRGYAINYLHYILLQCSVFLMQYVDWNISLLIFFACISVFSVLCCLYEVINWVVGLSTWVNRLSTLLRNPSFYTYPSLEKPLISYTSVWNHTTLAGK